MRKYILFTIPFAVIMILVSINCRLTVTEYGIERFNVAVLDGSLINMIENEVEDTIDSSKYIIKAKCIDDAQLNFLCTIQSVEIEEIYKGEGLKQGDVINVIPINSCIYQEDMSINMGFVNFMQPQKEYLIFLDYSQYSQEQDMEVYFTHDCMMTTIFAFEDRIYVIPELTSDENTYVNYEIVKDNEFFVSSEKGMEKLLLFKHKLIEQYCFSSDAVPVSYSVH